MELIEYVLSEAGESQADLARRINVSAVQISHWANRKRPVPPKRAAQIELATSGRVTRQELRPHDFDLIWPELARKDDQARAA